jgi:hypothetical protein
MNQETIDKFMIVGLLILLVLAISLGAYQAEKFNTHTETVREYYLRQLTYQTNRTLNAEQQAQDYYMQLQNTTAQLSKKPSVQYIIKESNCEYLSEVDQIAYDVAEATEYVVDVYDCTEFSRDLAKELQLKGYKAKAILTTVDCSSESWVTSPTCYQRKNNHMIVEVSKYIEATRGFEIPPEDYKDWGIKK